MLRGRPLQQLSPKGLRTHLLRRHVSSISKSLGTVEFTSDLAARTFRYKFPEDSNFHGDEINLIEAISSNVRTWNSAVLCEVIIGINENNSLRPTMEAATSSRPRGIANAKHPPPESELSSFLQRVERCFKEGQELSYLLANLSKSYVAVMDGYAMGGTAGLALHAPFRVATEHTVFAMPNMRYGYIAGGGVNYTLSRLDGQLGHYLSLTGFRLRHKAAFEHGIASHYVPARRIPDLVERLSSVEELSPDKVDEAIEELSFERSDSEEALSMEQRVAIDTVFSLPTLDEIMSLLIEVSAGQDWFALWAKSTRQQLLQRSPTMLRIALEAIRRSEGMTLENVLEMEMRLARITLKETQEQLTNPKSKGVISWADEAAADDVTKRERDQEVIRKYFDAPDESPILSFVDPQELSTGVNYGLPSEEEIRSLVNGTHLLTNGPIDNIESLMLHFQQLRGAKHGRDEKIMEILQRCCMEDEEGRLVWGENILPDKAMAED